MISFADVRQELEEKREERAANRFRELCLQGLDGLESARDYFETLGKRVKYGVRHHSYPDGSKPITLFRDSLERIHPSGMAMQVGKYLLEKWYFRQACLASLKRDLKYPDQ